MKTIVKEYNSKKNEINERLKEFKEVWKKSDKEVFSELCFCICTPQSKAVYCDECIRKLKKTGKLYTGSLEDVRKSLTKVRFPNNKTKYILYARDLFKKNNGIKIKKHIDPEDIFSTRQWFFENVKGIGYKEASHFLRNIGFGKDLAILDVHVLKNMVKYDLIKTLPKTITKKTYIKLEDKLRAFSNKIDIPLDALDLVFWSRQTGQIFK